MPWPWCTLHLEFARYQARPGAEDIEIVRRQAANDLHHRAGRAIFPRFLLRGIARPMAPGIRQVPTRQRRSQCGHRNQKTVTAEVPLRGLEVDGGQFDFFPVFVQRRGPRAPLLRWPCGMRTARQSRTKHVDPALPAETVITGNEEFYLNTPGALSIGKRALR